MKTNGKLVNSLCSFLIGLFTSSVLAENDPIEVGSVVSIHGEVLITEPASGELKRVSNGGMIRKGEMLTTDTTGFLLLNLNDGSTLSLEKQSRASVDDYYEGNTTRKGNFISTIIAGVFNYVDKNQHKTSGFKTPAARCQGEGPLALSGFVDAAGTTTFINRSGVITCAARVGGYTTKLEAPGQTVVIPFMGVPEFYGTPLEEHEVHFTQQSKSRRENIFLPQPGEKQVIPGPEIKWEDAVKAWEQSGGDKDAYIQRLKNLEAARKEATGRRDQ